MSISKIEAIATEFGSSSEEFRRYIELRRGDYLPVVRIISFVNHQLTITLIFTNGLEQHSIESDSSLFILFSLSHFWTMGGGLRLPCEFDSPSAVELPYRTAKSIRIAVKCGLLKALPNDIDSLRLVENGTPGGKREFEFTIKREIARALTHIPSDPSLVVELQIDGATHPIFRGYIDQCVIATTEPTGEEVVYFRGGDSLTGTRAVVSGLFNGLVNFDTSILFYSMFAEPRLLLGQSYIVPDLAGMGEFDQDLLPASRCEEFRNWLRRREELAEADSPLAREFLHVFSAEHPMHGTAPQSYKNLAALSRNNADLWMVIGSIYGLTVDGTIRIGSGVLVCDNDNLQVRFEDQQFGQPLCRGWESTAALLITFFIADDASNAEVLGKQSLLRAFDLLQLSVSDTRFEHSDGNESSYPTFVDGRSREARLVLNQWFHVHNIPSGVAHQYVLWQQRSSHVLEMTDFQAEAIRQRLDILTGLLNSPTKDRPKSYPHIDHAIMWFSRSKSSTTISERFMCLWISLEFLLIKSGDDSQRETIESGVASRISRLMGAGDRTSTKYWDRKTKEAYRIRCDIVHQANDDQSRIEALLPLLEQAAFEVIWYCTVNGQQHLSTEHPRDVLDHSMNQTSQ